jgi:predicted small secreted protein
MKTLKFLFTDLNQDERQILGGVVTFIAGTIFMIWLVSTNTLPVLGTKETKKTLNKSYELKGSYVKYAQRVYNEKYNN